MRIEIGAEWNLTTEKTKFERRPILLGISSCPANLLKTYPLTLPMSYSITPVLPNLTPETMNITL